MTKSRRNGILSMIKDLETATCYRKDSPEDQHRTAEIIRLKNLLWMN